MARAIRNYTCPVCGRDCSAHPGAWVRRNGKVYSLVQKVQTRAFKSIYTITYIHTACYEQIKRGKSQPKGGETNA